jgi:hypothetical protein
MGSNVAICFIMIMCKPSFGVYLIQVVNSVREDVIEHGTHKYGGEV